MVICEIIIIVMEGTRQIVHLLVYLIKLRKVVIITACLLIMLTLAYQRIADQEDTLNVLQQGNSNITEFERLSGRYPAYKIWDISGNPLGYAVIAHASGYGGELSVLTILNHQGVIENAIITNHVETPLYLKKVLENGFLERLRNTDISAFPKYGVDIDGVTSATMTSEAILYSVQRGGAQVGIEQLELPVQSPEKFTFAWQDLIVILLVMTAILFSALRWNKLRPWLLLASVIIFGFWLNVPLSLANLTGLLAGNIPSILERPIWYVLVPGILLVTLFWGRNFYCSWLCPFGAVQEGIYKALNLASYKPNSRLIKGTAATRWAFIWIAVMVALLFNNASIAGYEPFYVFFDSSGNVGQWLIMVIVLLLSIGVMRIWCRCFCPVGTILDIMARVKHKFGYRFKKEEQDATKEESNRAKEDNNLKSCTGHCTNYHGKQTPFSNTDKLLAVCLGVVYIGIVWSIIENIRI